MPGTIIKFIANYIKERKTYTYTHNHASIQHTFKKLSFTKVSSCHPPISKDYSNTFLDRSFIYNAPCEWNKLSEHIRTSNFNCFQKSVKNNVIYTTIWMLTVIVYNIIVIYLGITVNYCNCILLYSPLHSHLHVHWIFDFK